VQTVINWILPKISIGFSLRCVDSELKKLTVDRGLPQGRGGNCI
jgi:hypothetical protein